MSKRMKASEVYRRAAMKVFVDDDLPSCTAIQERVLKRNWNSKDGNRRIVQSYASLFLNHQSNCPCFDLGTQLRCDDELEGSALKGWRILALLLMSEIAKDEERHD